MTYRSHLVCIAALAALLAACSGQQNDPTDTRRGPLGKADTVGSCDGSCGGPSDDGNCWCDDLCEFYGDCCDDKADECDGAKACGGIAGLLCDEGQFCQFGSDQSCGFADQLGTCVEKPEACIEIFSPVCGCDGNTYANSCFADAAGVNIDHDGSCGPAGPLCLDDDDCGANSACDHTVCHTNCPEGMICPQVCWGECKPTTPPPPPDSCAGNCGGNAGACWCDDLCESYGDCCADKADECSGDDREPASGFCIKNSNDECESDADCTSGGCGGELCFNPDLGSGISTCECTAPTDVGGCGCVEGKCTWWN